MKEKSAIHLLYRFLFVLFYTTVLVADAKGQNLGVFDTLRVVSEKVRDSVAKEIYNVQLAALSDSSLVFSQLDALHQYAIEVNDQKLEVKALRLKSDYYWNNVEDGQSHCTELLKKAIDQSQAYGLELNLIDLYNRLGITLLIMNDYKEGFNYVLQSGKMIDDMEGEKLQGFNVSLYLLNIGWAYSWFFNHQRAIDYYKRALKLSDKDTTTTIYIYNSLGISYQESKRNDTALLYYKKALDLAERIADSSRIGLVSSNLGWIYQLRGEAKLARPMLVTSKRLMRKFECWRCLANISMNLAYTDLLENKLDTALQRAQEARVLLKTELVPDKLIVLSEYYDVLAEVYKRKGNLALSNRYMDSLVNTKDSINFKKNANLLANLETQITAEQYVAKLNAIELEKKKEQVLRNAIIALSILSIFILYLIYSKRVLKKRTSLELSLLEKENEIEQKKNEISMGKDQLAGYVKKVREKSTMIERLQKDIETMYPDYADSDHDIKQRKLLLEKLHSSNILTEEDWTEFKSIFERVHEGFFTRTLINYPELTIAQMRYIALMKLGLSTHEMANMLGISPDSVQRSIRRLRNKINVSSPLQFSELIKEL